MNIPEYLNITNEDNMDLMSRYPDNYFDLAIVDPPYGIDVTKMNMGSRKTIKPDKTKNWDSEIPSNKYFKELVRISKNQIIWGGNYFELPTSQYFCIWDKGETMYGRDFAEAEFAWVKNGGTRIYKGSPNQKNRIHPTQKPVALYTWLLQNYAKPNQKILDTHLGSGSIAIAIDQANKLEGMNLTLTACELDKDYYNDAMKRIATQCDWQPTFKPEQPTYEQTKLL